MNSSGQWRHFAEQQDIVNARQDKINKRGNQVVIATVQQCTSPSEGMSTDNTIGVQTRAMTEAQCIEGEANRELTNNLEKIQGAPTPAMNPTVDLHKTKEEAIKEFIRKQGTIA